MTPSDMARSTGSIFALGSVLVFMLAMVAVMVDIVVLVKKLVEIV